MKDLFPRLIKKTDIFILSLAALCGPILNSCDSSQSKYLVINELMSSNRTGLLNEEKKPTDWIEIKNTGGGDLNLKGYKLAVIKDASPEDVKANEKKKVDDEADENEEGKEEVKEKKQKPKEWKFPSVEIKGGENLVVFAEKRKKDEKEAPGLQANLKLPKSGGTLQLLSPSGKVLSEVKIPAMEADQSLARNSDGSYKPTFWQSPGYDNDRKGYESAMRKIDAERKDPLKIWELMSRAQHSYENWVELKNTGDKPVNLASYRLSKKMGKEPGWALPSRTLAPGEIITVKLVGSKANPADGLQAPFKVGDTETVVLTKDGRFVDGLCAKTTPYASSIGRQKDKEGYFFFATPTPGADNGTDGKGYVAEMPEWNRKPGIYKNQNKVSLKLKDAANGRKVHYTLDGSEPTMNSPVFKDSIVLTKPTVVRSFAEGDKEAMKSPVATASYLIGINHDLPVINISLDKEDLYGYETGIYANGPGYGGDFPYTNANFWKNWTKKAYIEMFDDKEGFASDCGLKIFGAYSRAEDKKSFRIKFRGEFGDAKVNYDFFGTGQPMEFEDLVLRSGSQDWARYMIKDEFFTSLAQSGSKSLLTQMYRPVALYVNAEYFGLYYLREKIDKNFVARKLNVPNDSIDVVMGSGAAFMEVQNRITSMDMTKKENMDYARQNIDLESLIDFKIGNIYSGKGDVGNTRYARSLSQGSDKKWRFIFYDIDVSWKPDGSPSVAFYLSTAPGAIVDEKKKYNALINSMLKNPEFRQMFLERLSYHLTNTYSAKNATAYFDKFVAQIRPEMKQNCQRWPKLGYQKWEENIKEFRSRFAGRPQKVLNDIRSYLHVTPEENKKYFGHLGY